MRNKFLTKILGATLGLAMAIGVGVGVAANNRVATKLDADQTYTNREFAFTSQSLPNGYAISSTGGLGSSLYKMSNGDYATIDSSALFNDGEVLSSANVSVSAKIGTFGTWSGAKTAKYRVAFLNSSSEELSFVVGDSVSGMSSSASYDNGPAVNLPKPSDPSQISKLKITFSDLTSPNSGSYLRFAGVKLTYQTETANASAVTSVTLTAAGNKTKLDLNETVQLTATVKDSEDAAIVGAEVSFVSSDPTVATVSNTGLVTASSSKYGSTEITASYAGDANHNSSSAKIKIKVANPAIRSFNIAEIASANSWENSKAYSSLGTIDNVTITGSGTGDNKKYYSSGNGTWRFYTSGSGQITISTSVGYLKSIEFTTEGTNYFSSAPQDWSYSDKVFTTSSKAKTSVTLSTSGSARVEQIDVLIGQAYTVSYNANGGSGTMTDVNSPYDKGSSVTVLDNTFNAPANSVFDHWDTKADDSGIDYVAGNTFTINSNVTLYAQWADAGSNPYVDYASDSISGVYSGQTNNIAFTYGNFANTLSLTSSNENVLTISNLNVADSSNSSATLNYVGGGNANLLFKDGASTIKTVPVTVTKTTLILNKDSTSINQAASETLVATTNVGGATWTSSNESAATVADGVVSVPANAAPGATSTITATSTVDGTVSATCVVTVLKADRMVTYSIEDFDAVSTSGFAPLGTSASFEQSYDKTLKQATAGNTFTLTISGFSGRTAITGITLDMHSNTGKSSSYGKLYYSVDGGSNVYLIGSADDDVQFNKWGDNDELTSTFKDVNIGSNLSIDVSSSFTLVIECTSNSLYCQGYTISFADNNQDIVSSKTTQASLTYTDYHAAAGDTFTYDNLAIRFGGLVNKNLFDSLENVTGYGVLVTTKAYLDNQEGENKLLKNHYNSSNENIKKFDSSATVSGAKVTPTVVGSDYKWNVYYRLPSSSVEELTRAYVTVAYIKTSAGVIFLKENKASAQSLAFDLLDNGTYELDAFGGSLYYMAFAE